MRELFKYDAFISYRRLDGSPFAENLRRRLIRFRLPKGIKAEWPTVKPQIYLDKIYERVSDDFFEKTIKPALKDSRCLIIIQTPGAVSAHTDQPNWVEREIAYFRSLPQGGNVFVALALGSFDDPLPTGLHLKRENIDRVDIRKIGPLAAFAADRAILPFIAEIYGIEDAQRPALTREEERLRVRQLSIYSLVTLFIVCSLAGAAIFAWIQRNEAISQRSRAEKATEIAVAQRKEADEQRAVAVNEKKKADAERRVAENQRDRAVSAEKQSTARRLAASAQLLRNQPGRLMLSTLLDLESVRRLPIVENRSFLSSIFAEMPGSRRDVARIPGAQKISTSPDGRWIVTATPHSIDTWDTATLKRRIHVDLGETSVSPAKGFVDPSQEIIISPDGSWITTLPANGALNLWDSESGRLLRKIAISGRVTAGKLSVNKDGKRVAFAIGKTVHVCETLPNGECWALDNVSATEIALWGTGDRVITCCATGTFQIRDVSSGAELSTFATKAVGGRVSLSHDEQFLIIKGFIRDLEVWDMSTLRERFHTNDEPGAFSRNFFVSSNSKWLGIESNNNSVEIMSLESGKSRTLQYPAAPVQQAFSFDGSWLVATLVDQTLRAWDMNTLSETQRFEDNVGFLGFTISPNASWIGTVGFDGSVNLWNTTNKTRKSAIPLPGLRWPAPTSIVSTNKKEILVNLGKQVQIWDADQQKLIATQGAPEAVIKMAIAPKSPGLIALSHRSGNMSEIGVWQSGELKNRIDTKGVVESFVLSPDGSLLARSNLSVTLNSLRDGKETLLVPPEKLRKKANWPNIVFSRNGRWLVASGNGMNSSHLVFKLWEIPSLREITQIPLSDASRVALSPIENIAALSEPHAAVLYDLNTHRQLSELKTAAQASFLSFDPSGRFLLLQFDMPNESAESAAHLEAKRSAGEGGRKITLWDWQRKKITTELKYEIGVTGLAFSVDGKWLAIALADQTVRICAFPSATEYIRLNFQEPIRSMSFVQDDRLLAVEQNTKISFEPWIAEDLLNRVCGAISRNLTSLEWSQYLDGERYRPTCPNAF